MKKRFYITLWIVMFIPYYISALNTAHEGNILSLRGDFDNCEISNETRGELQSCSVSIPNYATTAEPGKAELPIFSKLVSLPSTGNYALSNLSYDYYEQTLEHSIQYFGREDGIERDEDFYLGDEWYPKEIVSISSPVIMRGYRFSQVSIVAVQYNPARQVIRFLKDIDVEFTLDYNITENPLIDSKSRPSSSFSKIASEHIWGVEKNNIHDTGNYLIIAPDACMSILHPLAEWKRKLGHEVVLTPLSEIGTSPDNYDIKDYIQNAYDNWEIPPEFVLLVGDVTGSFVISSFYVEGYAAQWDVSDHPYTLLEGDDYFPDIFIGRFPIQSLMECATVVSKIIHYEGIFTEGDWYDSALMISGILSYTSAKPEMYTQYITKMNVRDKLLDFGFDNVDTFTYPYNVGTQQLITMIDGGYSLINFRGFGYYYYWDNGELILESDDISYLNNGYMLPMVTSMTCGGGDFAAEGTYRCFGEAWLTLGTSSTPNGAIGFIGPSEPDTKTRWNNCNDMGIYQGITQEGLYRCGEMMLRGKMELYNNYPHNHAWGGSEDSDQFYFYVYNLLGDPGLQVWTDTPKSISLICNDSIPCNQNYIVANVDVENNCSDFMVALTIGDSLITKGITDADGSVTLNTDFSPGTYEITASKYGYLPKTNDLTVYSDELLEITDYTFLDDPISGNIVQYEFTLYNPASYAVDDITILISSVDSVITVITDSIYITSIQSHEDHVCQNLFFEINGKWLDGHISGIVALMHSSLGDQSFKIPVEISSPELILSHFVVQNNDCCLIQGQEDNVFIELTNTGSTYTDFIHTVLTCTNDKATVSQNQSYYTTITSNGTGVNALPFSILPHQILTGESVHFEMQIIKNDSLIQRLQFSIPVGVISESSPTFSQYGYYAIESSDIGNFNAPVYDWIELDPSLGGEGTLIEGVYITVDGYITNIDLPFDVVYFGRFYDEITVCSEGWLSMREDIVYHRNKTIPSGCGPAAMIAPFWDDLQDGNIYKWFDESNHRFIIEWLDFANAYDPTHKETFEVILYDPEYYPTSNGNVETLFQYKSVSNVDQNDNYATVGIENFTQTDGVLLTYSNIYAPTAHVLQDETAILFTVHESSEIPLLQATPCSLSYTLPQDTTITDCIILINTSTTDLSYSISTSHYTDKGQTGGGKNIENDFIISSSAYYNTNMPTDIYCYLYHSSPDAESVYGVKMDFPDGVYVNDATNIRTLTYNGQMGYGVEVLWGYEQGLALNILGIHSYTINVTVEDTVTGPITIDWYIEGDGSGAPPHSTEGSITLEPSTNKYLWIEYPNGGETWVYSMVDTIRWSTYGSIDAVSIFLKTQIDGNWELITENIPNINEFACEIFGDVSNFCKINIRDANGYASDSSDDYFSINIFDITHPEDGDEIKYNTLDTLTWDYYGIYDEIILEISRDGGYNWNVVDESIPNSGEYEYIVSGPPSNWCVYKITSSDLSVSNYSHGNFKIVDPSVFWLSLGTHSGTLSGGESTNIYFDASTEGLGSGSYEAFLCIKSFIGQKINIPVTLEVTCSIEEQEENAKELSSHPNPFSLTTTISYFLKEYTYEKVCIMIYNVKGQLIQELKDVSHEMGLNEVEWDGNDFMGKRVSSGLYFYQIKCGNKTIWTNKCLFLGE